MPLQAYFALVGALPAILAMAWFDHQDAKRPEPRRTLRLVALAGALSAIPVIAIGELLKMLGPTDLVLVAQGESDSYGAALYMAFVVAAIPEEAVKLATVMLVVWRRPEFDERMDGITYGARAGLGFAALENVAYLLLMPSSLSEYVTLFLGRAILAVPGHATWGAIAGYFAAVKRFDGRGPGILGGFLVAVLLHGSYDAWLFSAPIAIHDGHTWLALGIAGFPIVAYSVPALIVVLGGAFVTTCMERAIADDDRAEAQRLLAAGWQVAAPPPPSGWQAPPWAPPDAMHADAPPPWPPPPPEPAPPPRSTGTLPYPPRAAEPTAAQEPAPPSRSRTVPYGSPDSTR
jgi:RsiW-degrading membrane proteinase PrsW (M82 family)